MTAAVPAMKLAPSLLAADLADLGRAVAVCEEGGADLLHFDVMDGHFVPNLTMGIPVLAALARRTRIPIDAHLMVANPSRLIDDYLKAGAARIAVHWEAEPHLDRLVAYIRAAGASPGVAVNPATPVELLVDVLPQLDYVLLMSVNPGFSGQRFLPRALDKARRLAALVRAAGRGIEIAMDGGIERDNIRSVVASGVSVCVAGSAIFSATDPVARMSELRTSARSETA